MLKSGELVSALRIFICAERIAQHNRVTYSFAAIPNVFIFR
jgi:hypothetical protein